MEEEKGCGQAVRFREAQGVLRGCGWSVQLDCESDEGTLDTDKVVWVVETQLCGHFEHECCDFQA